VLKRAAFKRARNVSNVTLVVSLSSSVTAVVARVPIVSLKGEA